MDTRPYFNEKTGLPNKYGDRKLGKSTENLDDFGIDEMAGKQRQTKAAPPPLADDFKFDIAIDGKIIKTMNNTEFRLMAHEVAYNEAIFTLYDDESTIEESGVELAIRIRSDIQDDTTHTGISITHLYYA